jgi:hypothetical protein
VGEQQGEHARAALGQARAGAGQIIGGDAQGGLELLDLHLQRVDPGDQGLAVGH